MAGAPRVPPMAELRLLRTMAQRVLDDTKSASELPEADRAAYLTRIAMRQKRLTELGERWVKAMEDQSRGPDVNMEAPKPPNNGEIPTTGDSDSGAKP